MQIIVVLLCCIFILLYPGILNRIAYTVNRKWCIPVNKMITTKTVLSLFGIFKTYMRFCLAREYELVPDLPEQYMVVSNHQSILDIPLYMSYLNGPRLRFVAKAELGRGIPLVSVMLRSNHHCLIKRTGSPMQAMKIMDKFAEESIKNNWIPVIFPEGSRSRTGALGTFHAAGFRRIVTKAPMPVAVCAVDGGWNISTVHGLAKNLRNGFYRVKVLKIYPAPQNKEEQVKILEEGKVLIQQQLDTWRKTKLT